MYKQSKNPYLNLMKSIKKIHQDTTISVSGKFNIYKKILISLENELKIYKFYRHPAFNNNWYAKDNVSNKSITESKLNLKNPWHLFLDDFKKIMNSSLLTEETKHKNLAIELNWFYNTPRVEDWVITNTKRKNNYA